MQLRYITYIEDFLHVIPSKLLIPAETLKTRDRNQNRFTTPPKAELVCVNENWSVVAVTLEKNVAIVVMWI